MNNRVALLLGGQNQELLYDFGTLDHIETITGEDPLNFAFNMKEHQSFKRGSFILVYAGLLSSYEEKGKPVDFSEEDVRKWMKRLTVSTIMSVINAWGVSKNLRASGEGAKDTQEA